MKITYSAFSVPAVYEKLQRTRQFLCPPDPRFKQQLKQEEKKI
jgi:hypothetical protein